MKEAYVSYEIAKILKEKGFNSPCHAIWHDNRIVLLAHLIDNDSLLLTDEYKFSIQKESLITIPTHQMACAWLREVHNILIIPRWIYDNNNSLVVYGYTIFKVFPLPYKDYSNEPIWYIKYDEAIEAAIKYSLENLMGNNYESK